MIKIHKYEDYKANFLHAMENGNYDVAQSYAIVLMELDKVIEKQNILDIIKNFTQKNYFLNSLCLKAYKPQENEFKIIKGWLNKL